MIEIMLLPVFCCTVLLNRSLQCAFYIYGRHKTKNYVNFAEIWRYTFTKYRTSAIPVMVQEKQ